jgi:hypothetical protein
MQGKGSWLAPQHPRTDKNFTPFSVIYKGFICSLPIIRIARHAFYCVNANSGSPALRLMVSCWISLRGMQGVEQH